MLRFLRVSVPVALLFAAGGSELAHGANFLVTPPFKIQQAVDAALASGDTSDVIFVNPGTYDEEVVVDAGGNAQKVLYLVRNTASRPVITQGIRIIDSRLVTFDGFDIRSDQSDSQAAVRIDGTTGAALVQCVFPAGDFGGVDALDTYEVVVNACTFGGMDEDANGNGGFGVRVRGKTGHRILSSKFGSDEGRSIWIEADRTEISGNTLSGSGGDSALYVDGIGNLVKKTTVKNAAGDGIRVEGTADVNSCTVDGCGGIGIRYGLDDTDTFTGGNINKCTITDNDSTGILVELGRDGVEIRNSEIDNNTGAGIRVKGDRCIVRDNEITGTDSGGTGGHGIVVDGASEGSFLRANTFKGNAGQAISVAGDDTYVLLNTASDTDGFIDSGADNSGRDNKTKGTNQFD
jgi:hypothetical protein